MSNSTLFKIKLCHSFVQSFTTLYSCHHLSLTWLNFAILKGLLLTRGKERGGLSFHFLETIYRQIMEVVRTIYARQCKRCYSIHRFWFVSLSTLSLLIFISYFMLTLCLLITLLSFLCSLICIWIFGVACASNRYLFHISRTSSYAHAITNHFLFQCHSFASLILSIPGLQFIKLNISSLS